VLPNWQANVGQAASLPTVRADFAGSFRAGRRSGQAGSLPYVRFCAPVTMPNPFLPIVLMPASQTKKAGSPA